MPDIQLRPELALRTGGEIGRGVRKDTPKLKALLNEFITEHLKGTQMAAVHLTTYQRRFKALHNATIAREWKKFEDTIAFFEKYGGKYGFDHPDAGRARLSGVTAESVCAQPCRAIFRT
ncbi:MAG TPA: hypothetical protein VF089_02530 [Candidatus Binatia bacterium]